MTGVYKHAKQLHTYKHFPIPHLAHDSQNQKVSIKNRRHAEQGRICHRDIANRAGSTPLTCSICRKGAVPLGPPNPNEVAISRSPAEV